MLSSSVMLARFNIVWHTHIMKDILFRYKILILLLVLSLAPNCNTLFQFIIFPAKDLFSFDVRSMLISLGCNVVIAWLWGMLHFSFFESSWQHYLNSLPLTQLEKISHTILFLIYCNTLIWIPIYISFIHAFINTTSFIDSVMVVLKMVGVLSIILFIQVSWIHRSRLRWLQLRQSFYKNNLIMTKSLIFFWIQLKNLFFQYNLLFVFIISLVISLFSLLIGKNIPYCENKILFVGMLMNGLLYSQLFVKLYESRALYQAILNSLPINKINLFINDLLITGFIFTIATSVLLVFRLRLLDFGLALIFLLTCYFPQIKLKRYGFVVCGFLMIFFIVVKVIYGN